MREEDWRSSPDKPPDRQTLETARMRPKLLVLLVLFLPRPAAAQTARAHVPALMDTKARIAAGDAAHVGLRPVDAWNVFRAIVEERPDEYAAIWRGAREAVSLGMLAREDHDRVRWYESAEEYARRAVRVAPDRVEGYEWLGITLGRRALDEGPRTKARLAVEIREVALRALEVDSTNAGAHHVLGEWHAEVRRLNRVTRWAARKLLGADVLKEASWEEAERHLRRAVDLEPSSLIHHLALGTLLLERGHEEEGRAELERVLALPTAEPTDPLNRQQAQDLLTGG
jgi:tetratricopeptide (TPR) repeat protein